MEKVKLQDNGDAKQQVSFYAAQIAKLQVIIVAYETTHITHILAYLLKYRYNNKNGHLATQKLCTRHFIGNLYIIWLTTIHTLLHSTGYKAHVNIVYTHQQYLAKHNTYVAWLQGTQYLLKSLQNLYNVIWSL